MNDIIYFVLAGAIFIGLITFLFNFMSNGFFLAWFKAKASRGKKILIIVKTKLNFYPAFGKVQGDSFVFYDHETKRDAGNKIAKRLKIPAKSPFFRLFNVWVCVIDEASGSFTDIRGEPNVAGFDPIFQESLLMRALVRPTFEQKKTLFFIIIILGIVILIFMGIFIIVKLNALPNLIRPAANVMVNGGQIIQGANV